MHVHEQCIIYGVLALKEGIHLYKEVILMCVHVQCHFIYLTVTTKIEL